MEELKLKLLPDLMAKLRIKASEEKKSIEQLITEILEKELSDVKSKSGTLSKPIPVKRSF